jgi:aminoacylase
LYQFIRKERLRTDLGKPALTQADVSNPWWVLLKDAVAKAGGKLGDPEVRSGATDARFARFKGIPAFQFSPMSNTPPLQHCHDEVSRNARLPLTPVF